MATMVDKNQTWKRLANGTMELIEEIEVERNIEESHSYEEYLLDLDYRISAIELGL